MNIKISVSGRDWSGWDFLGIVLGFFGIFGDFFLLILRLLFTIMCILAHLMCFDRSPESLNEYKHWAFDILDFVVHTLYVS
jgi:hypothetical protein